MRAHYRSGYRPPSKILDDIWIVERNHDMPPAVQGAVGKWLIYRDETEIDSLWRKIHALLRQGSLWEEAKVVSKGHLAGNLYVICVYTRDCNDAVDVMRIREELRSVGVEEVIHYKTDAASSRNLSECLYSA